MISKNIILINLPKLLIILLPGFLITGPFLADLSVSITALLFLIYCIIEKNYKYFNNFLFKILFTFYLWIIVCSIFSENIIFSLSTTFFYIRFLLFSSALYFFLENDSKLIKKIFFSFFFFFLLF